ncbi:hypothetical protein [Streptomyces sp. NPDC086776]|uniref:hypothetical protein n=1 Tax=Streptomyces sp. NPDC086776 TaxID=3365756 RepID=UPI0037FDD979
MPVGGGFSSCNCGGDSCASPTTPIATTGLCLPDGTPIAVVAERGCAGTVAQTGWLNLATGAYTTGVPPTGAAACGDTRSIQVSGVFCDVAADGISILGLVLVEYHYDDTGAIESVRLVDASTGATYALQGTLTICPSGGDDESPGEPTVVRQIVERCGCDDTDGDGLADVRYVELWSVDTTGASAAFLVGTYVDGDFDQPYVPIAPVDCATADGPGDESPGEPPCARQIVERCGCDDPDGDGIGEVFYTELWAVDPCGGAAPALLGAWVDGDFDQPYTPVVPVDCMPAGGDESPGEPEPRYQVNTIPLCVLDDTTGDVLQEIAAEVVYDTATGTRTSMRYVDRVTGDPVPVPGGAHLGVCPQTETCNDCSTLLLCDVDETSPSTIAGTAASGTLSNGVGWSVTAPSPFVPSRQGDGAAWWGVALFPNATVPLTTWTFDQPVTADFSVAMWFSADTTPGQNTVQLPAGAVPLSLPDGYTYDRATSILAVDATVTGCAQLQTPTREDSARFRVTGVSAFSLKYLGTRILAVECKSFGNWIFGAVDVSLGGQFLRTVCRDCDGTVSTVTDTALDGSTPYVPVGEVGVCEPPAQDEPCPSTVQILRLCDMNPDVAPDEDGKRCATPFLRHLVFDCTGALIETRDTATDATTAYTPVNVVDCASGQPALVELDWPQTGIIEDPTLPGRQDFIYTVTNPETGDAAQIHLHASSAAGEAACGVYDPSAPVFNNPTNYTLDLSPEAQAMMRFRLDFRDLDNFEGINALTPRPDNVVFENGTGTYDPATGNIRTNESANPGPTVYAYWNTPPARTTWGYANTGGGGACCMVAFLGTTLKPGGCCAGCGGSGDGVFPGEAEPCRNTSTLLLCDLPQDGEPALTVTDTDPTPYYSDPVAAPVTGAQALWAGGTLDLPPGTAPQPGTLGTVNSLAATLTTARPACDDGTATVTVSVLVAQTGPDDACGAAGHLRLFNGTQQVALEVVPNNAPVGWSATLTATATVPAADVAAGNVAVVMALDAYDSGSCTPDPRTTGWNLSQFTASTVYDQDTCAQQVLANVVSDCDTGEFVEISYTTLDGQAYEPTGQIGQCQPTGGAPDMGDVVDCEDGGRALLVKVCGSDESQPCRDTATALLCDVDPECQAGGTLTATDEPNPSQYPNWALGGWCLVQTPGQGAPVWSGGSVVLGPDPACPTSASGDTMRTIGVQLKAGSPAATAPVPVTVSVRVTNDGPNPGVVSDGRFSLWNATMGTRLFHTDVANSAPVGHQQTLTLSGNVPAAELAAGQIVAVLDVETYQGAGAKAWTVDEFEWSADVPSSDCASQFLRKIVTDCETGAVVSVTDTLLDGTPYTVTGDVGQCETVVPDPTTPAQPCGDTELAQLCDLTYDPQAPIPTPAGDFTLTGNVVVGNEGTTLWFAQANQVANGTAELTVSGLLPAVMYEFRFASAWIGAGAPDPANNNAIYLLEILDGTTVLAARTRNTSNGSNVFPGGVLSEDLPPLAFIAPATGAVTIRFTDQTTGGAINDRDLFLMPLEVRTAALTVTSTPFLRRFTFDCDGGLTSAQDLDLDGATPYVVQGEVGSCASSGDGSSVTAPTGDVVDCQDGSRALLVKVCDAGEESPGEPTPCRDSTTMLVCDIPASATTGVDADLTDSTGAASGVPVSWTDLPGPYTPLWSGGTLNVPAASGPAAVTSTVSGVLTAAVPAGCEAATGTLTVSARITNQGPDTGQAWDGTLQLRKAGTVLADAPYPTFAPAGQTFVRKVSVPVTLADLASGDLHVVLGFETYHLGAKSWTAEEFSAVVELEGCEATTATQILRTVVTDCETGEVVSTSDTTLDGDPYTVTGEVGQCVPADAQAACCPTGETLTLCDVAADGTTTAFLRRLTYTQDSVTPGVFDTELDGVTPYTVAGTVGVCPGSPDGPVKVVEQCGCDQTADGVVGYVELIAVAEDGTLTTIGTYDEDFVPYTPVSPVACPVVGAPPGTGVQARRVELTPGESWSAAGVTLLQSVTAVSHAGNSTITTVDGDSTLHDGESVTWSVARDTDAVLTGPLTITAGTGTVAVAFTAAVTL